jgi:hypothetical protein
MLVTGTRMTAGNAGTAFPVRGGPVEFLAAFASGDVIIDHGISQEKALFSFF